MSKDSKALGDILTERSRQIGMGFDAAHDDEHDKGELAFAAASYAMHYVHRQDASAPPSIWPFEPQAWSPEDYRSNLVRAAALIVAEIERLDRLPKPPQSYPQTAAIRPRA